MQDKPAACAAFLAHRQPVQQAHTLGSDVGNKCRFGIFSFGRDYALLVTL